MIFCSLYSGSSGNSIFIGDKESKILIDAGMPGKKIDEAMKSIGQDPSKLDGIFITHEHSDHIKGVGIISRKYDVPIYANDKTWAAMESSIGKVKEHNIKVMDRRTSVDIGSLSIKSFIIPHDAISPVGYTVSNGIKQVSVATDFGVFTEEIYSNVKDSEDTIRKLVTENLCESGKLIIAHSSSREFLNNMHSRKDKRVKKDRLIEVNKQKKLFKEIGLNVYEAFEDDNIYYLIINR